MDTTTAHERPRPTPLITAPPDRCMATPPPRRTSPGAGSCAPPPWPAAAWSRRASWRVLRPAPGDSGPTARACRPAPSRCGGRNEAPGSAAPSSAAPSMDHGASASPSDRRAERRAGPERPPRRRPRSPRAGPTTTSWPRPRSIGSSPPNTTSCRPQRHPRADARRRRQGLRADHRRDRAPDRRPGRAAGRARLQRRLDRARRSGSSRAIVSGPSSRTTSRRRPASISTARTCPTTSMACR